MTLIQELSAAVTALKASQTAADVGKVYESLVGYDAHKDDPSIGFAELACLAVDYVCEVCCAHSIHVAHVGLTPGHVSDFIQSTI